MIPVIIGSVAGVLVLLLVIYSTLIEPVRIELNEFELPVPPAVEELTILHLSDLHLRRFGRRERRLCSMLESLSPDLVLITGDFIEKAEGLNRYVSLFKSIRSRLGVFGVLGNNDYGYNTPTPRVSKITDFLRKQGIRILLNQSVSIDGGYCIIGLDDPHKGYDIIDEGFRNCRSSDLYRIVMVHSPETLDFILSRSPDLVLTGHTHGGQIAFPVIGPVFLNIKKGYRVKSGLNYFKDIPVYLSRGIGTTMLPVRFNCRPEITLIKLRHHDNSSN